MNVPTKINNDRAFTLVEVLVVIVIMGLAATAMYSLFIQTQQKAGTQEEVAETQQNLRIAMNFLTRDIQMAGFLIPTTNSAIESAPADLSGGQVLTLRTASTDTDIARLTGTVSVGNSPSTAYAFAIATAEMVNLFAAGDKVRLLKTPDHDQRIDLVFTIDSAPSSTSLAIKGFNAVANYNQADLLVKVDNSTSPHPYQIDYDLNNNQLRRTINGGTPDIIADNISAVEFEYLTTSGQTSAVRVTLTGTALDLKTKTNKTRQLVKLITLKNN